MNFMNFLLYKLRASHGKPYSEVTAAFLPSSLGIFHSFAFVFSTRPPVSVCGTDHSILSLENFLGSALNCISLGRTLNLFTPLGFIIKERFPDLPENHPDGINSNPIMSAMYCTPSSHRRYYKSWNINHVSIACGFRHSLRPD